MYKLFKDCLYVIYFGGDENLGLVVDDEVRDIWRGLLLEFYVLFFGCKVC